MGYNGILFIVGTGYEETCGIMGCANENYFDVSRPGPGRYVLFMGISAVVYAFIVLLLEVRVFAKIGHKINTSRYGKFNSAFRGKKTFRKK